MACQPFQHAVTYGVPAVSVLQSLGVPAVSVLQTMIEDPLDSDSNTRIQGILFYRLEV